jgi:hypothetical protein
MKLASVIFCLTLLHPIAIVDVKGAPDNGGYDGHCAYIGHWGSFHLVGSNCTAAYQLGKGKYIANLSFSREDRSFWYFVPSGGDPLTAEWAFARLPDRCCRKYWVWRRSQNGKWKRYEATRAWGDVLPDKSVGGAESVASDLNQKLTELNDQLEKLDTKVKDIDGRLIEVQKKVEK